MNKEMKKHLETVVESIIFSDNDAATAAFHDYISKKTQSILLGESDDEDCDEEDCDDKEDEDKDDKKSKKPKKEDEDKDDDKEDKEEK